MAFVMAGFSLSGLSHLYLANAQLVDFLVITLFFLAIARAAIGQRFRGSSGKVIILIIAVVLAVGGLRIESEFGFTLWSLGPIGALVIGVTIVSLAILHIIRWLAQSSSGKAGFHTIARRESLRQRGVAKALREAAGHGLALTAEALRQLHELRQHVASGHQESGEAIVTLQRQVGRELAAVKTRLQAVSSLAERSKESNRSVYRRLHQKEGKQASRKQRAAVTRASRIEVGKMKLAEDIQRQRAVLEQVQVRAQTALELATRTFTEGNPRAAAALIDKAVHEVRQLAGGEKKLKRLAGKLGALVQADEAQSAETARQGST